LLLADKNDKKFVKMLANEDTQKAQGTGSLSENSSTSEVTAIHFSSQKADFAASI